MNAPNDTELEQIERLMISGNAEAAAEHLRRRLRRRGDEPGWHVDEARLAERLGMSAAAVRCWQQALSEDPTCEAALNGLASLHAERGDHRRAAACRARLDRLSGAEDSIPAPHRAAPSNSVPGAVEVSDLVRFVHLFAGREGVHARMWHERSRGTGYSPVHQPFTPEIARAHLSGGLTAGVYLLRVDGTVTLFVFDLDATPRSLELAHGDAARTRALRRELHEDGLRLLGALRARGLDPLLVDSGYKGRHLWCFLPEPLPAGEVLKKGRALRAAVAPTSPRLNLEFFPKQSRPGPKGLGNLVKLPLGLHLRSRRRAVLLDDAGAPIAEPFTRLRTIERRPLPSGLGASPDEAPADEPGAASDAPVVAAPPKPGWTETDYEAHPRVAGVLQACPVLRTLVEKGLRERRLERSEVLAVRHTLGHLPAGVSACNYLFDKLPDFPEEERLGAPLRGNPVSCSKLRRRLPALTKRVPCECSFAKVSGRYPHPLRHLESAPAPVEDDTPGTLDELLEAWARGLERRRRFEEELNKLRSRVVDALRHAPDGRWSVNGGVWCLEDDEGMPVLRWTPEGGT